MTRLIFVFPFFFSFLPLLSLLLSLAIIIAIIIAIIGTVLYTRTAWGVLYVSYGSHNIFIHHITSHHITSHHITLHHITSHHITSHHITPKKKGFSSSVVAVTVLPKASLVANTWMKWYDFMKKVHTLIYIRNLINGKQEQEQKQQQHQQQQQLVININDESVIDNDSKTTTSVNNHTLTNKQQQSSREEITMSSTITLDNGNNETNTSATATTATTTTTTTTKEFMYNDFNVLKYARSLGYIHEEIDIVAEFIDGMGVEEFNVFAINYARKAGGLSLTWKKKNFNRYDIERLKEERKKNCDRIEDIL
jgi:hypothetical protein